MQLIGEFSQKKNIFFIILKNKNGDFFSSKVLSSKRKQEKKKSKEIKEKKKACHRIQDHKVHFSISLHYITMLQKILNPCITKDALLSPLTKHWLQNQVETYKKKSHKSKYSKATFLKEPHHPNKVKAKG